MEEGAYFLLVGATTTSAATPSEYEIREVLFSTFEALGGITRAIVHFDVLSIKTSASALSSPPLAELWIRLHKEYVDYEAYSGQHHLTVSLLDTTGSFLAC